MTSVSDSGIKPDENSRIKEEENMLSRIKSEPDQVIQDYMPLVKSLSKRFNYPNPDDLESVGMYALTRAVRALNRSTSQTPSPIGYIISAIKRKMLDEIRASRRINKTHVPLKYRIVKNRFEEYSELETDLSTEPFDLERLITLSPFERLIVTEIRDGYTYLEVSARNKISVGQIQVILESLRRRIKE
jgi:RNA polymerase sigma factor (sigma-70 family)